MKYFITLLILFGVYAAVKFLIECAKDLSSGTNIEESETNSIDIPVKESKAKSWHTAPPIKKSGTDTEHPRKRVA